MQPLGKDRQQYSEGVFGKTFIAYVGIEVDVKVGDRVVDQDGIYYLVSDMVERDFGAFPFRELIIKKTK